ncbi:hypothetical protein HZA97_07200 [Candidatus Woesearchaeota archaeon]|nr:hypothetical protein [Candidatus Woesearchaeota archaeon]
MATIVTESKTRSLNDLLDEVEVVWREEVRDQFPLWGDISVVKEAKKVEAGRDWSFYTDLKKIWALIFKDEDLRKKFDNVVTKYWSGSSEELARDTLHYLLYHELYHPVEAPSSKEDNKKIHQSIRRGILRAEPHLKPKEQVMKVLASQNAVKDFILDNRFYLDNKESGWVRDDIIPIWDLLELEKSPEKTNFYTITRFLYGAFYGPESVQGFFSQKTKSKGVELAVKAVNVLLNRKDSSKEGSLIDKVKKYFGSKSGKVFENVSEIVSDVRNVFSSEDRYAGIERFMSVLGPYVEQGMPNGRNDVQGEGSGSDMDSVLQDLLDDMTSEEQQEFLQDLANVDEEGKRKDNSSEGLDLFATHEFYKKNCPEVRIKSGGKVGEQVVVGKKERFVLKSSKVINQTELSKLNFAGISRFQQRTKLPVLIPLGDGVYRLNEYKIKSQELRNIVYVEQSVDVPDVVEFYLDSSGSMNRGNTGFNDGSSWDMLSNVLYGYLGALSQASKLLRKSCKVIFHNVADQQISSDEIDVNAFLENPATDILKVIFEPDNGYSKEDLDIKIRNDGKKRAHVVVTDGNLCIGGRTERESKKMIQLAKQPNTDVLLFEIGGTYSLGNAIKNNREVHYFPVHDKNKMLSDGLEVLITK